ncbi:MAG: peptidoglycan DD-metalloendopeptidase family protein [Polyangiaceae bacterium]|nr:peptidoglycan DD-metalloendopeptidase family protein [Polyangiaceae bacterium]
MRASSRRLAPVLLLLGAPACGGADDFEFAGAEEPAAASGGTGAVLGGGLPTAGGAGGASGSAGGGEAGGGGDAGAAASSGGSSSAPTLPSNCPRVQVTVPSGQVLNVRPAPSTQGAPVGTLASGAIVDALALVQGETLDGNPLWFQIESPGVTGYVWSGLVACTQAAPPTLSPGFYLPLECGKSAKVTQGNNGSYSHQGLSAYAFDFSLGTGTPMVAMDAGTVSYVYDKTGPGDACYSGGDKSCAPYANIVYVMHADGTRTVYAHLSKVLVTKGQQVARGQKVGLSGSSGYSTGPHAHVARIKDCTPSGCQSIPLKFQDVSGTGVPKTGDTVTSGNCPS